MLARVARSRTGSTGHTGSRGTNQRFPAHRFSHCRLALNPAGGVWTTRHVASANGCASTRYPIAHTGGDHTDIVGNGDAC